MRPIPRLADMRCLFVPRLAELLVCSAPRWVACLSLAPDAMWKSQFDTFVRWRLIFLESGNNGGSFCASCDAYLSWLVDVPYLNLWALWWFWVVILTSVRKSFTKERKIMMKHVNFKEQKKAVQIVSKRSAVIPTLQKELPLSHKGVEVLSTKSCRYPEQEWRAPKFSEVWHTHAKHITSLSYVSPFFPFIPFPPSGLHSTTISPGRYPSLWEGIHHVRDHIWRIVYHSKTGQFTFFFNIYYFQRLPNKSRNRHLAQWCPNFEALNFYALCGFANAAFREKTFVQHVPWSYDLLRISD